MITRFLSKFIHKLVMKRPLNTIIYSRLLFILNILNAYTRLMLGIFTKYLIT